VPGPAASNPTVPHAATPISRSRVAERTAAVEPGPLAGDDDGSARDQRSGFAWLWPWVLASIGFLMTLALLR